MLWLTGVDYFSTLGYQPGIALLAAGVLSPVATLILLAVTLGCALPMYGEVARRSYVGQGSIALLENAFSGWWGKVFVLVLLGFAFTDFVVTMTLSAADAAAHAVENPYVHDLLAGRQIPITVGLLVLLTLVFLAGFREAIGVASLIAVPYLLLNVIVITRAFFEVAQDPSLFTSWRHAVHARGDPFELLLLAALMFPRLALGLSGFETGVAVMPLVAGEGDEPGAVPTERIRATRKLLATSAVIMSLMLLSSSVVTTLLIPETAYREGGPAAGRAIAYLAHELLGSGFGTVYDLSTIAILWFAGASAMAGMLNLIPRYLPRFGMAPQWTEHVRPLVLAIFGVALVVTLVFRADVEAQAGAYATGVLVLMFAGAVAVTASLWNEAHAPGASGVRVGKIARSVFFAGVSAVFAFTLADNVKERPDGVVIASLFIAGALALGALSRYRRSTELRVANLVFADAESARLWPEIVGKRIHLVPLRERSTAGRERKGAEIRRDYAVDGPTAYLHVELTNNTSEFLASLRMRIRRRDGDFDIDVGGAVAIANTIAYFSELTDPKSIFLGLTRRNPMTQAFEYLLWGEGEIGIMVYSILVRYWDWTPEEDVRPVIFLKSD